MLQNLREHVQGWIAGVIASILGLAFALWGVEYYLNNGPTETIIAKVNGDEITQNQLDVAYNRLRQAQQLQPADSAENEVFQKQLKIRALNGLIQERVLTRAANKAGYIISPLQVGAVLQQMPGFQINGQFSYELFQRTLLNLSYTPEIFSQEIAKSALLQQVQGSLVESNFALPDDVNRHILLYSQKRDFGYILISPAPFLSTASVTDQDVLNYYKTNNKKFITPEQISLQYLMLSTEDASKKMVITDAELMQYYTENKASFVVPQQGQAANINAQPPDFAKVKQQVEKNFRQQKADEWVAEQSDKLANLTYTHPDSLKPTADALNLPIQTTAFFARQGEKTGLLSNPKILSAAFSDNVLKQRNNSDIIPIDDNTVLVVRIADYKPAVAVPLPKVRADIEKVLKQEVAQKMAIALGEKIVKDMKAGISPQQLATQNKLTWVEKANVAREAKDIPPQILKLVFNQPAPGTSKKPVVQGEKEVDGSYVIIAVNALTKGVLTAVTADQRLALKRQMDNAFGELDYALYLEQEMDKAKIKMENTP